MEFIRANLAKKLSGKGFTPLELTRLVKDVKNILDDSDYFTLFLLNEKLGNLGWETGLLDQFSFELILVLLETEQGWPLAEQPMLHSSN